MKSAVLSFLLTVFCSALFSAAAAAATSDPTVYKITVKKLEASTDGTNFVTIQEKDQEIDIASVASGAQAGSYCSGIIIPDGVYTTLRVTITNQLTLQGNLTQDAGFNNGVNFCTDSSGTPDTGACTPEEQVFTITSDAGFPSTLTLDAGAGTMTVVDTSQSFTIDSSNPEASYRMSFDVTDALVIEADDTMHPGVPSITITDV